MSQYISILIWLGVCAVFADFAKLKKPELVCGVNEERYPWIFAFIVFLPLIIMAGTRGDFADTIVYRGNFLKTVPDSFPQLLEHLPDVSKDKGFTVLISVIKMIIGKRDILYFTILASIQGIIVLSVFRKYSASYILSIFLFVVSNDYIGWMYNGIRQFTAVTIIFAAIYLVISKKYLPMIIIILLASTIHASALIVIPLVFIVQGEAWNKKTVLLIFAMILVIAFVGVVTPLLDSALSDTQYSDTISAFNEMKEDDGTNPIRVLIYSIPAIISFFGRKQIVEANNKVINICTNMSIISAGLYLVSMFTSGIFVGRLPIYCSLYSYILLPWEIENIFKDNIKTFVYLGLVAGYLGFYYYQMHMIWGLI